MAKKSIGYVKLEWVCPNCSTKNPGPQKTCLACGAPQPANVQFIKAVQDVLLSDEKELQQAKAGANVHCPYCGARNQAGADSCSQCGADLAEARARLTGQVLGAFQDRAQTVECPSCQTPNPSDASFCITCGASLTAPTVPAGPAVGESPAASASSANQKKLNPLLIILPAAFVVLACVLFLIFSSKKTDVNAQVIDASWVRNIVIEEYGPVSDTDWRSDIPSGASIGECDLAYHYTAAEPEPVSTEVCSTPYVVDSGTGYGDVVTDCEYKVYEERCQYTIEKWYTLTTVTSNGNGISPAWPQTSLTSSQREGSRSEEYRVLFESGSETYTYTTSSYDKYQRLTPGSVWKLSINAFGKVVDVQPAE